MKDMKKECDDSFDNNFGLFDFLSNTIGIKVLHPPVRLRTSKVANVRLRLIYLSRIHQDWLCLPVKFVNIKLCNLCF